LNTCEWASTSHL